MGWDGRGAWVGERQREMEVLYLEFNNYFSHIRRIGG